jgi:hypothetical protein
MTIAEVQNNSCNLWQISNSAVSRTLYLSCKRNAVLSMQAKGRAKLRAEIDKQAKNEREPAGAARVGGRNRRPHFLA